MDITLFLLYFAQIKIKQLWYPSPRFKTSLFTLYNFLLTISKNIKNKYRKRREYTMVLAAFAKQYHLQTI